MEKVIIDEKEINLKKLSLQERKGLQEGEEIFYKNLNGEWEADTIEEVDGDLLWLKCSSDINLDEVDVYIEEKADEYDVLSPDGFSIHFSDVYKSIEEALEKAKEWVKNYEFQGYYSSVKYGRIPLNEILDYCKIIKR